MSSTLSNFAQLVDFHTEEPHAAVLTSLYQVGEHQSISMNRVERKKKTQEFYLWVGFKSNKHTAPEMMAKEKVIKKYSVFAFCEDKKGASDEKKSLKITVLSHLTQWNIEHKIGPVFGSSMKIDPIDRL